MTIIKNILKMSLRNIVNNKLRSMLTMLGLVIGIASVIVLVGIGNGTSKSITNEVLSLGTNVLTLSITSSDYYLDYEDLDDLRIFLMLKVYHHIKMYQLEYQDKHHLHQEQIFLL